MARWYGNVGFEITKKTAPGVWKPVLEPHPYSGDTVSVRSSYQNSGNVIDDIQLNMNLEIIADPFAYQNFMHIRYVEMYGQKFKVTGADPTNYPRIVLTVGGLYEADED